MPESARRRLGLPKGATYARKLAKALVDRAVRGDTAAARELTDRIEGKAVARLEHAGSECASIEVSTEAVDAKLRRLLGLT